MKKLLFPSAIVCALCCVALVTPASALPVTSDNVTHTWGIYTATPFSVPTVEVNVSFRCDNPNATAQSFNENFYLFRDDISTGYLVSSKTLPKNINPGISKYNYLYQNNNTEYPSTGNKYTIYYNLPGDSTTSPVILREDSKIY